MTNRKLAYIIKHQTPLVLPIGETAGAACRAMCETGAGSALVADQDGRLAGIFTGRDVVRLLSKGGSGDAPLSQTMTADPLSLPPTARALDAVRAMCEGGFRHVPVTEDGRICGVVSRGDFKGMEFECYAWPSTGSTARVTPNRELAEMIAGKATMTAAPTDTIETACRMMWTAKAGSVVVVDERHHPIGIFTGRDAVRALAHAKSSATALSDAMTRTLVSLAPSSHAIDALRLMCDGGFRHLPVIDDGRIVGVVSRNDFTGVELDRLDEEEQLKECIW